MLVRACERAGVDPSGAELVRLGSNAVYRLAKPVIVRITRDGDTLENVRRHVAVARWLESEVFPSTRAVDIAQPVDVDGHLATFWESASERVEYAPIQHVADVIRRLHSLTAPAELMLPTTCPFVELGERLSNLRSLETGDEDFVRRRIGELHDRYESLSFALEPGVIHGDANVGNVIMSRDGDPVLIDLDSVAIGHREWDLVQTALFYDRFGWHTDEEYRTFVSVYGFDITKWEGYPVLADYREIAMTLWLGGKSESDQRAANEVRKRIASIRSGGARRDWAPF
ncbi:aminoglycoside phosphotransferase family protein [Actinophytocola sp.]|uniref:phosphotransferase family protein n=1 Tax=Actinophytocola sp. TaxID=1872138 RepID=UPI0025BBBBEC|nr:aminoglycoside phosphotransferase family protein [Actinophytocola sp.]